MKNMKIVWICVASALRALVFTIPIAVELFQSQRRLEVALKNHRRSYEHIS